MNQQQHERERLRLLAEATRIAKEIDQIFIDVEHWNRVHSDKAPIDPDPDGELRRGRFQAQRVIMATRSKP